MNLTQLSKTVLAMLEHHSPEEQAAAAGMDVVTFRRCSSLRSVRDALTDAARSLAEEQSPEEVRRALMTGRELMLAVREQQAEERARWFGGVLCSECTREWLPEWPSCIEPLPVNWDPDRIAETSKEVDAMDPGGPHKAALASVVVALLDGAEIPAELDHLVEESGRLLFQRKTNQERRLLQTSQEQRQEAQRFRVHWRKRLGGRCGECHRMWPADWPIDSIPSDVIAAVDERQKRWFWDRLKRPPSTQQQGGPSE